MTPGSATLEDFNAKELAHLVGGQLKTQPYITLENTLA